MKAISLNMLGRIMKISDNDALIGKQLTLMNPENC